MIFTTRVLVFLILPLLTGVSVAPKSVESSIKRNISVHQTNNSLRLKIVSPYENVKWRSVNQVKTSLHCHTLNANAPIGEWNDGNTTMPADLLSKYKELGYGAVAITDHDYVTYPWSNYGSTENSIISFPGSELSKHTADMLSYGTDFHDKKGEGQKVSNGFFKNIEYIASRGGFMIIAHPSRSKNLSNDFWVDVLEKYPHVIGIEVLNAGQFSNNHSEDLWDYALTRLMPRRNVWGTSSDDAHSVNATGTGWTNLLLNDKNMNVKGAIAALKNGVTYFSTYRVIKGLDDKKTRPHIPAPRIKSIKTDNKAGTIIITSDNATVIEWISAGGVVVARGDTIDINNTKNISKYVRARIKGDGGQTLTQAFALE